MNGLWTSLMRSLHTKKEAAKLVEQPAQPRSKVSVSPGLNLHLTAKRHLLNAFLGQLCRLTILYFSLLWFRSGMDTKIQLNWRLKMLLVNLWNVVAMINVK